MKIKTCLILSVYALLLGGCAGSTIVDEPVNVKASLPADFYFTKQGFKVISTLIDKKKAKKLTFNPGTTHPEKRISYILDQKPSIMP